MCHAVRGFAPQSLCPEISHYSSFPPDVRPATLSDYRSLPIPLLGLKVMGSPPEPWETLDSEQHGVWVAWRERASPGVSD